ncbi:ubiquinone biosynthesis protein [Tamaricihabitans halophyticus]|uniref:Ubiquinone biosynthesis protein n=1 Tax=Tamaricihabitans halophyticus TaxID=1262583 RepID=A0A4R2QDS2_9PSEU|nr:AarF/UbiB family protein [Tamaricihabitans halophyticus]TCP47213.1 ubiquinone biosynthesis protein [Tamaricihabitans halophyticus]
MEFAVGVSGSVIAVLFVFLLAGLARRVLGVPVGWPRAVVLGFVVAGATSSLLVIILERAGLVSGTRLLVDPGVVSLIGILAIAWMFVLGLAGLVILEVVLPTGSVPGPVALLNRWRRQRRRARRYTKIVAIAARHGLGRFVRAGARLGRSSEPAMADTAVALRRAFEDAGVAFVKLGQMLSTRRDLLPPALVNELTKLQEQVQPAPWSEIEPAITTALGRPIDEVFRSIEEVPLASASVGQVHQARLLDGREVVVKVQRPSVLKQTTSDLDIILQLARRLDRVTAWGRSIGILGLAEGFAASLREELDYTVELDNTRAVAATLADDDLIKVPETYPELCGPTLLVMAKLDGASVTAAADLLAGFTEEQRAELATEIFGEVLRQIMVHGVFHADLHPGNILIRPDRTVGLLDFGSVGRLDSPARTALGLLLAAIDRNDPIAATDALIELLGRPEGLDQRGVERAIGELLVRYRGGAGSRGSAGMFASLFKVVLEHQFTVPAQVAAAFRAIGALEGTLGLINPGFDLLGAAKERGADVLRSAMRPEDVRQQLEGQLAGWMPMLQRLPQRLNKITEDLEKGQFGIRVRALADERDRAFLTGIARQVMTTILAAATTIGAIMLMTSDTGPMLTPTLPLYAFLGYALLFVGFVLGLRVLVRMFFRSSRE